MHGDILIRRNKEPHHIFFAIGNAAFRFLHAKCQRIGHFAAGACIVLEIRHFFALGFQFFRRIKGIVGVSRIQQLLDILVIDFPPFGLTIRTVNAFSVRGFKTNAFVYFDAEPIQCLDDIFLGTWNESGRIGIFDTQKHIAAVLTNKKIVIQGGSHTTDMQRSCRRGRKTNTYFHFRRLIKFAAKVQ